MNGPGYPRVENLERYRVMLAGDDRTHIEHVHNLLLAAQGVQFDISRTASLAECRQKLAEMPFDVLLLDPRLPDAQGLAAIQALSQDQKTLPMLVLAREGDIDFALQAIESGAQDCLTRGSYDSEALTRSIRFAIGRNRRQKQPRNKKTMDRQLLATRIFQTIGDGIMVTDATATIQAVNPAFCRITGYSEDEVIGKNSRLLKSDRHHQTFYHAIWHALQSRGEWAGEVWNQRKNGEIFREWLTISSLRDEEGKISNFIAVFADISNIHRSHPDTERLIWRDALTGLSNRALFLRQLQQVLTVVQRNGGYAVVLLLDLDRFRDINEARGASMGNAVLKLVARSLRKALHSDDLLARLDSDEFAVLLPQPVPDRETAGREALVVAEKLRSALQQNIELDGERFHIDASVGITVFPEFLDETASDILRQADMAMHRAKETSGGRTIFFEAIMGETIRERYRVEHELREAVINSQLRLYVQPQLASGLQLVGAEALVRWVHPQRNIVLPAMFIPLAETTDLIVAVDRWMLEAVCQLLGRLKREKRTLRISTNISPRHFQQPDFVEEVKRQLELNGADPNQLVLEITEGLVIDDFADVITKMTLLRKIGVNFSMDDFGTGYSSLAYLKRLPIHELKIDKSFIQDVTTNTNDAALVESILAVAQHLHLQVVAEGVETTEQADFLNARGEFVHQGFLYGKPEPVEKWLGRLPPADQPAAHPDP